MTPAFWVVQASWAQGALGRELGGLGRTPVVGCYQGGSALPPTGQAVRDVAFQVVAEVGKTPVTEAMEER